MHLSFILLLELQCTEENACFNVTECVVQMSAQADPLVLDGTKIITDYKESIKHKHEFSVLSYTSILKENKILPAIYEYKNTWTFFL